MVFSAELSNLPTKLGKSFTMKNDFYTYAYLREDGTPYYIGKGRANRAFRKHKNVAVPPKERILFLKRNLTEGDALKHEIYMIALYGRKDIGTGILWNFTDGGEGSSGAIVSSETRKKLSEALKGMKKPPRSEETRRKLSEARKGLKLPKEWRENIGKASKGRVFSEERNRKISEAKKGKKRPPISEETRRKMSIAQKKRWEVTK